jgi:alpha-beta hydrolase superfamily lysophospholipase
VKVVKRTRSIAVFVGAGLVMWLLLCAAIGVIAVEGALHPARLAVSAEDEQRAATIARENHAVLTNVEVAAKDGAVLRAWSLIPAVGNHDSVVLLHGQGDNRAGMLGPAGMLLRHGYAVLLPDARAHGMSGGQIGTYGVLEADDIRRWFEWLQQSESPQCVDGLGDSMGGAELLRSLGAEHGFCAAVAESAFASFREAAYDRLGQQFSTGPWLGRTLLRPALAVGMAYVRLRYGVDFRDADPAGTVASSHVPVLLIHGLADTNLPSRHSEMIKAGSPAVVLWEPAAANHCGASSTEPAEYERRVVGWFATHTLH